MSFSFRYRPITLESGNIIKRPLIPLILKGKYEREVLAILDYGSDFSIIPKQIAEFLDLEIFGENEVFGISRSPI